MLPGGVAALCSVLDTDDSGGLSKEEFTQVQERELTLTLTITLTQVQERDFGLFERIGPNANGIVTLERFTEFIFDLITQEGPSVAAALVLELRQGAARRFVEQEAWTVSTPRALTTMPPVTRFTHQPLPPQPLISGSALGRPRRSTTKTSKTAASSTLKNANSQRRCSQRWRPNWDQTRCSIWTSNWHSR